MRSFKSKLRVTYRSASVRPNKYEYFIEKMENSLNVRLKAYNNKFFNPLLSGEKYEMKFTSKTNFGTKNKKLILPFPIIIKNVVESTHKCREKMELIIAITSSPNSFLERYTYRKIYNEYRSNIEYYFFVGMSINETINELIKEENEKYNDLIQFDFLSHYYNVTYQTIGSIRWINEHCKNYKYVVEHQSDVFFNIKKYINEYKDKNIQSVLGCINDRIVIRDNQSIWYIPYSVYNREKYPIYPIGPCVIMTEKITKRLCDVSQIYKLVLFIDDVYLGLLMEKGNIRIKRINNYVAINYHYLPKISAKYITNKLIWIHGVLPGGLLHLSNVMNSNKKLSK